MGWRVGAPLLVGGGLLLLAGFLMVGGFDDKDGLNGGPLAPSADEGITGSGVRLDPGDVFNDRGGLVINKSTQVAVLTSIRQLGAVGHLRHPRIYVALGTSVDPDGAVTGAGEGFPPRFYERKDLKDPHGFRIPPSRSKAGRYGAVIMTFGQVQAGETFGLRGYELTYRVGTTKYQTVVPHAVAACAARRERCDPGPLLDRMLAAASAARGRRTSGLFRRRTAGFRPGAKLMSASTCGTMALMAPLSSTQSPSSRG